MNYKDLLNEMKLSLSKTLNVKLYYEDISGLIESYEKLFPQYSYFWKWMNEVGLHEIDRLNNLHFVSTDETVDFLTYRRFVLKMDTQSNEPDQVFTSIVKLLNTTKSIIR